MESEEQKVKYGQPGGGGTSDPSSRPKRSAWSGRTPALCCPRRCLELSSHGSAPTALRWQVLWSFSREMADFKMPLLSLLTALGFRCCKGFSSCPEVGLRSAAARGVLVPWPGNELLSPALWSLWAIWWLKKKIYEILIPLWKKSPNWTKISPASKDQTVVPEVMQLTWFPSASYNLISTQEIRERDALLYFTRKQVPGGTLEDSAQRALEAGWADSMRPLPSPV